MMIKKILNFKFVIRNCQAGMTYVELIVVLSIFAIMSSIILYNYEKFQAKVDIKNLASDVALRIVEAQKSALSGKWNVDANAVPDWKPSYGVYFNTSSADEKKKFTYFANFNDDIYDSNTNTDSILDQFSITKNNNIISKLEVIGCPSPEVSNLSIVFRRPDSKAIITSNPPLSCVISYAQITVSAPNTVIKIYPSGRIQVN